VKPGPAVVSPIVELEPSEANPAEPESQEPAAPVPVAQAGSIAD
jgi:hypothetical protein